MKIRKLGNIIFFAVTLIVFGAGTVFTCVHRWNTEADVISRANLLAMFGALFLTVAELAFIFIHAMLDARDEWRRYFAYALSLLLVATISYATASEAMAFMNEGNLSTKTAIVKDFNKEQQSNAKSKKAQVAAIVAGQSTMNEVLKDFKSQSFAPFAVNFIAGLFVLLTGTLIQPREAWRRRGNVMNERIRVQAESQIGSPLPQGATAYDDGKGSTLKVQKGRQYLTTVSKRKIGF